MSGDRLREATDGLPKLITDVLRKYGGTMKGRGDHDIFDALVRYREALAADERGGGEGWMALLAECDAIAASDHDEYDCPGAVAYDRLRAYVLAADERGGGGLADALVHWYLPDDPDGDMQFVHGWNEAIREVVARLAAAQPDSHAAGGLARAHDPGPERCSACGGVHDDPAILGLLTRRLLRAAESGEPRPWDPREPGYG